MSYTQVFGGGTVSPALDSYISYTLTSVVSLVWPQETAPNSNLAAQLIEFSAASTGSYGVNLPPANMVSVGQFLIFNNLSSFNQAIFNNLGATIVAAVPPGAIFFLYLQNNSTVAGQWFGFQYGSAISTPSVAAIAGNGLKAFGTQIAQNIPVLNISSNYAITASATSEGIIATLLNWTGGAGTITLPLAATAGSGYYVQVRNNGSSSLTLQTSGTDIINAGTAGGYITFNPGDSAFVVTDGTSWYTIGLGTVQPVFFNFQSINVAGVSSPLILGTTAASSLNKIAYKFTGTPASNPLIVQLPAYAQTYWINNQTPDSLQFQVAYPTAAGTTQTVPTLTQEILYSDGANIVNAVSGSGLSNPVTLLQGGTGVAATTTGQVLTALGGSSIGVSVFQATSNAVAQAAIASPSTADSLVFSMVF
jgi:hypothetical protein